MAKELTQMEEQEGHDIYFCLHTGKVVPTDEIKDTDREYRDERICYGLRSRDHRTCVNGAGAGCSPSAPTACYSNLNVTRDCFVTIHAGGDGT